MNTSSKSTKSFTPPEKAATPIPARFSRPRAPVVPGKRFTGVLIKSFDPKLCEFRNFRANDGSFLTTDAIHMGNYTGKAHCTMSKFPATAVYENGKLVEFDSGIVVEEESQQGRS